MEEVKRGAERGGEKTNPAEEQQEEQVKRERLDAQPTLISYQLKDHPLGKIIFATSLPLPELCVLVVTQKYFLSVVVTPALFSEGHKVHTYESPSGVCHGHFQSTPFLLSFYFIPRDLKGNLQRKEIHELNI